MSQAPDGPGHELAPHSHGGPTQSPGDPHTDQALPPPLVTDQALPPRPDTDLDTDPRVADALSRLGEVEDLPLPEQVEVFTDIHRRLAAVLADPDSRA